MPVHRWFYRSKALFSLLLVLILILAVVPPPVARAQTSFIITNATDASDSYLGDGICWNGAVEGCTLRAAIEEAFSSTPPVSIGFSSSLAGSTFYLTLGPILWSANNTILDGETNNITIDGSGLTPGQSAFQISGSSNTISHLTIRGAPQDGIQVGDFAGVGAGNYNVIQNLAIYGNGAGGIYVHGSAIGGSQTNIIRSNTIGIPSSSVTACETGMGNGYDGIYIDSSAQATDINNDFIACNGHNGIFIDGTGGAPNNTSVTNNDIGLDTVASLGNGWEGVHDYLGDGTIVANSMIGGNGGAGVWLQGSLNSSIRGNFIGSLDGFTAAPNGHDGVAVTDGAQYVTIGGIGPGDRNYISGNAWCGVRIRDGAVANTVTYNTIGLDLLGNALPNGLAGIAVINAADNLIGASDGSSQYISGNSGEGIYIENSDGTAIYSSNYIGVNFAGTPQGNGLAGIFLSGATNTDARPSAIVDNGGPGIAVVGDGATGNRIQPLQVYGNGGIAIDLGNDGPTQNGTQFPPGPNNWIEHPIIIGVAGDVIQGTTCSSCQVNIYRAIGDPTIAGGGGTYLMSVLADAGGNWTATLSGVLPGQVTMVAVDTSTGDSSEMGFLFWVTTYRVFMPNVMKNANP